MPWLTSGEEEMGGWLVFPHLPMHLYVYLLLVAGQKNKSHKGTKDKNGRNLNVDDGEEHEGVSEVWIITLSVSAAVLLLLLLLIFYYLHKRMSRVHRGEMELESGDRTFVNEPEKRPPPYTQTTLGAFSPEAAQTAMPVAVVVEVVEVVEVNIPTSPEPWSTSLIQIMCGTPTLQD
ncbi:hypothetical protein ACOMHN_013866 [Nucella lapillus]